MPKRILQVLIGSLLAFLIISAPSFAQAISKVNCCRVKRDIQLDNVTTCPVGVDPDGGCINGTFTFLANRVVGPAEDRVFNCSLGGTSTPIQDATPHWGMVCLINSVYKVTDIVFWFALSLSIIMGIVSAFFFLTAAGEPSKIERARNVFIGVVVGTVIAVSAKLITSLIISIVV
jgi:hypothetical protein